MTVDWTKPIEAYHPNGRVAPAKHIGEGGHVYCVDTFGDGKFRYGGNGLGSFNGWRIRNVTSTSPEPTKTLRDEFAMAALTGLAAAVNGPGCADWDYYSVAAYHIADAMLEARK